MPEVGGDNLNYDFGLDLEALNTPFPSPSGGTDQAGDAIALLTDTTQLETNLDTVTNDPTATLGYNLTNSNYFFLIHYDDGTPVAGTSDLLASPASGSPSTLPLRNRRAFVARDLPARLRDDAAPQAERPAHLSNN